MRARLNAAGKQYLVPLPLQRARERKGEIERKDRQVQHKADVVELRQKILGSADGPQKIWAQLVARPRFCIKGPCR
jgi:hypothetical protein